VVFGITYKDKPADSVAFLKSKGLTYPNAIDADAVIASKFGVRGTPTIVLVDKKGVIRYQGNELPTRKVIDQVLK
jgi:cytochrome c biogenesis protein CcmG/thiol:disulfide interchange protein DsbE